MRPNNLLWLNKGTSRDVPSHTPMGSCNEKINTKFGKIRILKIILIRFLLYEIEYKIEQPWIIAVIFLKHKPVELSLTSWFHCFTILSILASFLHRIAIFPRYEFNCWIFEPILLSYVSTVAIFSCKRLNRKKYAYSY